MPLGIAHLPTPKIISGFVGWTIKWAPPKPLKQKFLLEINVQCSPKSFDL
jgi:hypothetical protein